MNVLGDVVEFLAYAIAICIIAAGLWLLWHATAQALEEWRRG